MGWTGTKHDPLPLRHKDREQLLLAIFYDQGWLQPTKVLQHRIIRDVWYAKVETTLQDGSTRRWIAVCLYRWEDGELWTKFMDNTVGPAYYDCPVSWFRDIPVEGQFDLHWRDVCRAHQRKSVFHPAQLPG